MLFPVYKMTSAYGPRTLSNGDARFHYGIDIVGVGYTHVLSPVKGIVVQSRIVTDTNSLTSEWGNYVAIRTIDNCVHYFCHLATRYVKLGELVSVGDSLGLMGKTGYSVGGAHTHYGIKTPSGVWTDPVKYHKLNIVEDVIYTISEVKDMTVTEATRIVQSKTGLEDATINYLLKYAYGDALMIKLAKAML